MRISAAIVALVCFALSAQAQSTLVAPTGLEASDGSYSTKVGLSWDHVRGAQSYRIFRHSTNDPSAAVEIGSTSSIIFYDRQGEAGKTFFYWVKATRPGTESAFSAPDEGVRAIGKLSAFGPIGPLQPPPVPVDNAVTGAKVYLGKTLFWDEQLSSTRTVACGTCHIFSRGSTDPRVRVGASHSTNPGVDEKFGSADDIFGSPGVPLSAADGAYEWSTSFGFNPQVTRRKAQSVVDAAYSDIGLFWDGRADRTFLDPETSEIVFKNAAPLESQALESQALDPFLSSTEMAHQGRTLADLVTRIIESQPLALAPSLPPSLQAWVSGRSYRQLFAEAFGTPDVTPVGIAMAIAYIRAHALFRSHHNRCHRFRHRRALTRGPARATIILREFLQRMPSRVSARRQPLSLCRHSPRQRRHRSCRGHQKGHRPGPFSDTKSAQRRRAFAIHAQRQPGNSRRCHRVL